MDNLQAKIVQIPRRENEQVGLLTKAASTKHMVILDKVLSFIHFSPLIDVINVQEISSESNWTTTLVFYLKDNTLLNSKKTARKLKVQAARFVLIKDILYKKGFSCSFLRYLSPEEADYILREVHEGICRKHLGLQTLVHKLIRTGYYWPTCRRIPKHMSKVQLCHQIIDRIANPNDGPMAFHSMVTGHHGPVPYSNTTAKVPHSWHRLFHQMGQS